MYLYVAISDAIMSLNDDKDTHDDCGSDPQNIVDCLSLMTSEARGTPLIVNKFNLDDPCLIFTIFLHPGPESYPCPIYNQKIMDIICPHTFSLEILSTLLSRHQKIFFFIYRLYHYYLLN